LTPPAPPPPRRLDPYIYQSKALDVDSKYMIFFIKTCACRPKVMLTGASCQNVHLYAHSVYIRYFKQGITIYTYGHIRCVYTVLANPTRTVEVRLCHSPHPLIPAAFAYTLHIVRISLLSHTPKRSDRAIRLIPLNQQPLLARFILLRISLLEPRTEERLDCVRI